MLEDVAVVGAAGKMGRGISLVLLQEIALLKLENPAASFKLYLSDTRLEGLRPFLKEHLRKFAEKKINLLRRLVAANPKLVSNGEIIDAFLEGAAECYWMGSDLLPAKVVFEAITEDIEAKVELFKKLQCDLILSNTSSIPIHILKERSGKEVVGFHFYNPPYVQKLVELVSPVAEAFEWAKLLGKQVVVSNDVAGFIGNGHFIREINLACDMVKELSKTHGEAQAIYMVNKMTRDLGRPMGIFELIDYVGFDVCVKIANIMSLPPPLYRNVLGEFPESDTTLLAQKFAEESGKIARQLVTDGVAKSIEDVNTVLKEGFHHSHGV